MSEARVIIREAQQRERSLIEAKTGESLGSDHCIIVYLDAELVGWGDDYGTFHPLHSSFNITQEAGENLLQAFSDFWDAALKGKSDDA